MNNPEKFFSVVGSIVIISVVCVSFFLAVNKGLGNSERIECEKWQKQADEFPGWYSLDWQREQCKAHGITLPK